MHEGKGVAMAISVVVIQSLDHIATMHLSMLCPPPIRLPPHQIGLSAVGQGEDLTN